MARQGNAGLHGGELERMERESERTCWICFATESENRNAKWLHPCQCSGSTKWVHESCLYRWIDEKQNGNTRMKVACMQCRVEYIVIFPKISRMAVILERFQDIIRHCSPFLVASVFLGAVYWSAITFGGMSVLQVFGQQRGLEIIEKGDPLFLLVGLPLIPVGLILTRLIRWEDTALRLWRNRRNILLKLPLIHLLCNAEADDSYTVGELAPPMVPEEPADFSRIFCGAIMLPTIATTMGKLIYRFISAPLHRTLLGGITFIALKGIFKIYMRQKIYLNKTRRQIVDYTEENIRLYRTAGQNNQAPQRQYAGYDETDSDYEDDDDVDARSDPTTSDAEELEVIHREIIVSVPDGPYTLFFGQI